MVTNELKIDVCSEIVACFVAVDSNSHTVAWSCKQCIIGVALALSIQQHCIVHHHCSKMHSSQTLHSSSSLVFSHPIQSSNKPTEEKFALVASHEFSINVQDVIKSPQECVVRGSSRVTSALTLIRRDWNKRLHKCQHSTQKC